MTERWPSGGDAVPSRWGRTGSARKPIRDWDGDLVPVGTQHRRRIPRFYASPNL